MTYTKLTFNLFLLIFLAGCLEEGETNKQKSSNASGQVNSTLAKVIPQTEKINGHIVPLDPGKLSDKTVEGVDTDKNGIRDEIDRYIAKKYGAEKIKFFAAQELAKAKQLILVTPKTDINATTAVNANADSGVCLADKFENDIVTAIRMNDDLVLRTFDTKDRQKQRQAISFKVGQFTRSTEGVICK